MFIHIGADETVNQSEIVMILNLNGEKAEAHEEWLAQMRREGRMRVLGDSEHKCAVILAPRGRSARRSRVLLSPVNPATIVKREAEKPWLESADEL